MPEWLEFQGRYGIIPGEDLPQARRQFEAALAQAAGSDAWLRLHPPVVEWWGGQYAPARVSVDQPVVQTLSAAFQAATGSPSRFEGMTYGSDMRILVNQGHTPAVLFGPGDVRRPTSRMSSCPWMTFWLSLARWPWPPCSSVVTHRRGTLLPTP